MVNFVDEEFAFEDGTVASRRTGHRRTLLRQGQGGNDGRAAGADRSVRGMRCSIEVVTEQLTSGEYCRLLVEKE